jgi:hypothetical protein
LPRHDVDEGSVVEDESLLTRILRQCTSFPVNGRRIRPLADDAEKGQTSGVGAPLTVTQVPFNSR